MKLKLADALSLPLEVVTQKLAWLGVTGSGKTYGASKLAELLWHVGAQFVVLDPVGVWYGLRLAKDGKKPSAVTIPIFGGLHGDVPLEPTGGALLANLIVDKTLSAVIDVSQFESDAQKARFALDFAERFFFRKKAAPSAVHVFLEECQEFVPQNPQKGDERMLHAFTRMQKLGRNFGIGSSYISQRPQEVNKKALNMAQTLFVFRTTGTHERTAIEKWIEDKSLDETIANDLPKIPTGDCHVWSPEFLKISETVHILEKATFNASATPEVGVAAKARELAPIDLEQVRSDMAATIEKAKADDPRELRKQIGELRTQLSKAAHNMRPLGQPKVETKVVEKFVLKDGQVDKLGRAIEHLGKIQSGQLEQLRKVYAPLTTACADILLAIQKVSLTTACADLARAPRERLTPPKAVGGSRPVSPQPARPARSVPPSGGNGDGAVTPARQKILNALAFFDGIGVQAVDKTQLALMVGVSPTSGGYFNNLGALRTSGHLHYPSGGSVALTDAGAAIANTDGIPSTTDELHDAIRAKLPPAKWRILEVLIEAYPKPVSKDALAETINVSPTSGGYFNNLGSLRTLGLVDYPQPGHVAALPVLFLEER